MTLRLDVSCHVTVDEEYTFGVLLARLYAGDLPLGGIEFDPTYGSRTESQALVKPESFYYDCPNGGFGWDYRRNVLTLSLAREEGQAELHYPCSLQEAQELGKKMYEILERCWGMEQ